MPKFISGCPLSLNLYIQDARNKRSRKLLSYMFILLLLDMSEFLNLSWIKKKKFWRKRDHWSHFNHISNTERVTGRKSRGLQMEEIGWKCQTFFFLSPLSSKRKLCIYPRLFLQGGSAKDAINKGSTNQYVLLIHCSSNLCQWSYMFTWKPAFL